MEDKGSSYKSTDWEMIEKKKIGSQVKVHVSNLRKPRTCRQVRVLNEDHVESLKLVFKDSFRPAFTKLVGLVKERPSNDADYAVPGKSCIEVLGGNHTREALKSLGTNGFVYMELYANLTDMQALTIGVEHNRVNDNAKLMTFQDVVLLMRKVLDLTKETQSSQDSAKSISTKWRSNICSILGKSKKDVKNTYKTHLHLAALGNEEWNALLEVFNAFEQGKIKKEGRSHKQPTQYVFMLFIRIPYGVEEKKRLLIELASGELAINQFRETCKRYVDERRAVVENGMERCIEVSGSEDMDASCENICPSKRKHLRPESQIEQEKQGQIDFLSTCLEREKGLRKNAQATLAAKEKEVKQRDDRIKGLERKVKEIKDYAMTLDETNKNTKRKLETCEHRIDDLMNETKSLESKLAGEKLRCKAAEQTAARARYQLKCKDMTCKDVSVPIKRKQEDDDDKDQCSRIKQSCTVRSTVKNKVEQSDEKQVLQDTTLQETRVPMAIVEYNEGKVYYVKVQNKKMVYCSRPFGHFENNYFIHEPKKQSFILNSKDVQDFDESFIICHLEGTFKGNKILVDKMSINIGEQLNAINRYIKL